MENNKDSHDLIEGKNKDFTILPNKALSFSSKISPKTFLLYAYYCRKRDTTKKTDLAWPALKTISRELGIPKTTVCTLRKELFRIGWLVQLNGDTVKVITKDLPEPTANPKSEAKKEKRRQEKLERRSKNSNVTQLEQRSENSNKSAKNSNKSFEKLESHNKKNETTDQNQLRKPEERVTSEQFEQANSLLSVFIEAYDDLVQGPADQSRLQFEVSIIQGKQVTVSDVKEFLKGARLPPINFLSSDFLLWRKNKSRSQQKNKSEAYVGANSANVLPITAKQPVEKPIAVQPTESEPDSTVWGEISAAIEEKVPAEQFATWFEPLKGVGYDGNTLLVWVPNKIFETLILNNYRDVLEESLPESITGVRFVTTAETSVEQNQQREAA